MHIYTVKVVGKNGAEDTYTDVSRHTYDNQSLTLFLESGKVIEIPSNQIEGSPKIGLTEKKQINS